MKDYVPLLQTGLWVIALLITVAVLRPEVVALRKALRERLDGGAAVAIGPVQLGELNRRIDEVHGEVADLQGRVASLFLLAMSDSMYANLRKLAEGPFGHFEKTPGLERELRFLRDMGYVRVPGDTGVAGIPNTAADLSNFVMVTEAGRMFVELRKKSVGR